MFTLDLDMYDTMKTFGILVMLGLTAASFTGDAGADTVHTESFRFFPGNIDNPGLAKPAVRLRVDDEFCDRGYILFRFSFSDDQIRAVNRVIVNDNSGVFFRDQFWQVRGQQLLPSKIVRQSRGDQEHFSPLVLSPTYSEALGLALKLKPGYAKLDLERQFEKKRITVAVCVSFVDGSQAWSKSLDLRGHPSPASSLAIGAGVAITRWVNTSNVDDVSGLGIIQKTYVPQLRLPYRMPIRALDARSRSCAARAPPTCYHPI